MSMHRNVKELKEEMKTLRTENNKLTARVSELESGGIRQTRFYDHFIRTQRHANDELWNSMEFLTERFVELRDLTDRRFNELTASSVSI